MPPNQDEIYRQFLKLVADPTAFADRKKMLEEVRADLDALNAAAAVAKNEADFRTQEAHKLEAANNMVKMALDKRANELSVFEINLKKTEKELNARLSADRRELETRIEEHTGAHSLAMQHVQAAQAALDDREVKCLAAEQKLSEQQAGLMQAQLAFQKIRSDADAAMQGKEKALAAKEQALTDRQAAFDLYVADQRKVLADELAQHEEKVVGLKSLIHTIATALD